MHIDSFKIEEDCKIEWRLNPKIREEFLGLEDYTAFKLAEARGQVKILGGKK